MLEGPAAVFVSNGEVYIAEAAGNRIRKILSDGQTVTICGHGHVKELEDGVPADTVKIDHPTSVFVSASNQVYFSEGSSKIVRRIDELGSIRTVDMDINVPRGLFVTEDEQVYVADCASHQIKKVRFGKTIIVAGTGIAGCSGDGELAIHAQLRNPTGVIVEDGVVYFSDLGNERVCKVDHHGIISTIAKISAFGIVFHNGQLFATNYFKHRVEKFVDGKFKAIENEQVKLSAPCGLCSDGKFIYIADFNNDRIVKLNPVNNEMTVVVGDAHSADIPFDFNLYPHVGKKGRRIKAFPNAFFDVVIVLMDDLPFLNGSCL